MSIETYTMRILIVENFVDTHETRIKKSLIDIVLVMDDIGTYIQKHAPEVHWVQHRMDVGDDQNNTLN